MKKRSAGAILLVLMVLLMGVSVFAATISGAKQEIDRIQQEINKTKSRLKELDSLKSDLEAYIVELDTELNQLAAELTEIESQMEQKQEEIEITKEELEVAKENERQQYEAMKVRIQYMYERGDTELVEILFSSENISELLNSVEYISQLTEYDRDMLDVYVAVKEEIQAKEERLEAEYAELEELKTENEAKQASVQTIMEAKAAEVEKYEAEMGDAEGQILDFEDDIAEQQEIIARIEKQLEESRKAAEASRKAAEESRKAAEESRRAEEESRRAEESAGQTNEGEENGTSGEKETQEPETEETTKAPSSSVSSSGHIWPLASRNITSYFGTRTDPVTGEKGASHSGIDIAAPYGSPIMASASGVVITVGYTSINGNYVKVYHGNGIITAYCHCSSIVVEEGQSVSQGQTIAKVGNTGKSTGNHLHYCVGVNGTYVNPLNYVSP